MRKSGDVFRECRLNRRKCQRNFLEEEEDWNKREEIPWGQSHKERGSRPGNDRVKGDENREKPD